MEDAHHGRKMSADHGCCGRREFLQAAGAAGGLALLASAKGLEAGEASAPPPAKKTPTVLGAFLYRPTEQLAKEGYWSWPGSSFDPEGHQKRYSAKVSRLSRDLGMEITLEPKPLAAGSDVARFIARVKQEQPDGLLLFMFKKWLNKHAHRIVKETGLPMVVSMPLGGVLLGHILGWQRKGGTVLINAEQNFDAVADGMRMIRTARWMADARLVNLQGNKARQGEVPSLGTQVRTLPLKRFYEAFKSVEKDADKVKQLAGAYRSGAKEIVEPGRDDIRDAARTYFAFKRILEEHGGDGLMMDCLPGLKHPHQHVPPCMGYMSLHNEGLAAGCQSDLDATLTMMLGTHLLGVPGFQHNPSWNTAENRYFGAHCTAPSKMNEPDAEPMRYILRSHNEAGWGCVPQVLFPDGQPATLAHYFPGDKPRMIVYSGEVVRCYPKLAGGCRTNVEMTIHGVDEPSALKHGNHMMLFLGRHAERLKGFCKLYGIEVLS